MEIPKFEYQCYSLIIVESTTGKVLNKDKSYYNSEGNDYFILRNSVEEAELFISENLTKEIDISIYDNKGVFLKFYSLLNK